ncbi:radical SAM family heme chaperone HemW [Ferrovibrio sp.]|uniref:radical SAM family heme chaperone HemW n=1 Tax=Ferrovibrio sp. TaxID=1917215 RepID=UPI0025C45698|nr:radical SAM family heme chaperone HemW [Ferrovibrio sp.]MBX3455591.1 coproporphyrinogen III oxidase [Ferrovibrio sp.]
MPVSAEQNQAPSPGFGLYVHWPFCVSKCPYCDFNSHVRERIDEAQFRAALLVELRGQAERFGTDAKLTSVFFGGGTPSLMAPETTAAILAEAEKLYGFASDIEITLEANPNSAEAGKFVGFRAAGVNRLSIGVQSFDAQALRFLGRAHDADEARQAIKAARRSMPRYSFDLIYARPSQDEAAWRDELGAALDLAGDHLSLYTLTIEPNTGFAGAVARGAIKPMEDDAQAALYDLTQEIMQQAGLPAYEISNHARPGGESRHNLVYWRSGAYLGIGPGAHARLRENGQWLARQTLRKPEVWLEAVQAKGSGLESETPVDARQRAEEALMMGLRLREGVYDVNLRAASGIGLAELVPPARSKPLEAAGLLQRDPHRLVATDAGRAVLDGLLARLLA